MEPGSALDADWLALCRSAAAGLREMLAGLPATADRSREMGVGEGGDRSLIVDTRAEEVIFAHLDELHAAGHRFTAISEERGEVDYGGGRVRVLIDPIDGSLNAKRGAVHHALSVAVADGGTMADVRFAYVHELGTGEEFSARAGAGARFGGRAIDPSPGERRSRDGKLEVVGIESADPRWVAEAIEELAARAHRLRALGSIALSLCQVAVARFDGMATIKRCRGVDAAAGQLIVREAGGWVSFTGCAEPLGAPLDLAPQSPLIAARSERALAELAGVPAV